MQEKNKSDDYELDSGLVELLKSIPYNDQLHVVEQFANLQRKIGASASTIKEKFERSIFKCLSNKNTIYDSEKGRTLLFLEGSLYNLDKQTQEVILSTYDRYFDETVVKPFKNGTYDPDKIGEALVTFEYITSAIVASKPLTRTAKNVFGFLGKNFAQGPEEKQKELKAQLVKFFSASKANIPTQELKADGYRCNNREEKLFQRQCFISDFVEGGLCDLDFLEDNGIFEELDFENFNNIYSTISTITPEKFRKKAFVYGNFESTREMLEYYLINDKETFYNKIARSTEIADLVVDGTLELRDIKRVPNQELAKCSKETINGLFSIEDLSRVKGLPLLELRENKNGKRVYHISKNFLDQLDRERLLSLMESEHIAYDLPYSSKDYIKMFGKLNVDDMIHLAENEYIDSKDLIDLIEMDSLSVIDSDEYEKICDRLSSYYDLDKLESLVNDKKLNQGFIEKYNKLLSSLDDTKKKIYVDSLNKSFASKENAAELYLTLYKNGLDINSGIRVDITDEKLEELYINEEFEDSDVIRLYQAGVIKQKQLKTFYSDSDLIEMFEKGEIDYSALSLLDSKGELLKKEFEAKRLTIDQVINLYSRGEDFSLDDMNAIFENYDISNIDLSEFIPDDISREKIEELFLNFYISHDDISNLVERKIITREEADAYAEKLTSHEAYESLFGLGSSKVSLIKETEPGEVREKGLSIGNGTRSRASQIKIDPELKEQLLVELGFDSRKLYLSGTNNSLDGYEVYPSENLGLMVFINKDKPGNAGYVMSLQQGMFWLNKINRSTTQGKDLTIIESEATKKDLRETEHVKVRNDSKMWGKNMLDSMKLLSPRLRERLKNDKDYKENVDLIISEIKEDYDQRREM